METCSHERLMQRAGKYGFAVLAEQYASVSEFDGYPFQLEVVEESFEFFNDALDPKQPPLYWVAEGRELVLGGRSGLSEGEFRREFPQLELRPTMCVVGVTQVATGHFQFTVYHGDLMMLVAACGYGR